MKSENRLPALFVMLLLLPAAARAQRFLPDDPIKKDPDNMPIARPARIELSLSYDIIENTFGFKDTGALLRARNTNTLGEVPDSSWFTNRIGVRDMTLEELARGANLTGGPDTSVPLTIMGAGLFSYTEGLVVQDTRGDRYYLIFDPAGLPYMATGAAVVANKFFYAAGYNVLPASVAILDSRQLSISRGARVVMPGGKEAPLDREFVNLFLERAERRSDGRYRAAAYGIPPGDSLGEFKFYGTRSDDPNDVFPHQDRRELRGMGVFAAWLNHYHYRSINTLDRYETFDGSAQVRHYLMDFSTALGSGNDLNGRIVPKDMQSGNEYILWGDLGATLKTAVSLGFWKRPWMKVDYPYPQYAEIGRFEADFFQPDKWRPEYPNAAYSRMLPDDAFWATVILARFSDDAIRAIVRTGEYADPEAEKYLVDTLIKRRDKIIAYYFKRINPLDRFAVAGEYLEFENLGVKAGLANDPYYEYVIHTFDNKSEELNAITDRTIAHETRIPLPKDPAEFLMVRIRTRSHQQLGWRKNVDVYLRMKGSPSLVGIDREVGAFVLDRNLEGRLVVRSNVEFGGSYQGLSEEQRRLVDDWFRRFNATSKRQVATEQEYDKLPLSVRTTFDAVTHALTATPLTDESGHGMGLAIDLVQRVETVHGSIQGAGGDEQFRIYVELVPDAVKILDASREFKRERDNTVYHKGYPSSYRQQQGPPSMQISVAENGMRADIDLDYRSSKFPAALVNGHLASSNSDVRAGNNFSRHIGRWEGFVNWWRGLFGLPFMTELMGALDPEQARIPQKPRKGRGKLEDAVQDWLTAWLIEAKPEQAVAYLAQSSFACMEVWSEDNPVDYGMAPLMMLDTFAAANQAIGKVGDLREVVKPETLSDARLRAVEHPRSDLFALYEVPEDLALQFDCALRNSPRKEEPAGASGSYGKYFGTAFRLASPASGHGGRVILLWSQEGKEWRIISYATDPEFREAIDVPDLRPTTEVTLPKMKGDPVLLEAVDRFGESWGTGDIDGALDYFAPKSLGCVRTYLEGETPPGDEAARQRLRQGLERVYKAFSQAKDVMTFTKPVAFVHPDIRIVDQPKADQYSLGALPDHMGAAFTCDGSLERAAWQRPQENVYGNYYAAAVRFSLIGEDPAVLYLLWAREEGSWKIVASMVVTP